MLKTKEGLVLRVTLLSMSAALAVAGGGQGQDLLGLKGIGPLGGQSNEQRVTATLVSDVKAVQPGQPLALGVKLDIPKGYYAYYKSAGAIGLPTRIELSAPEGFQVGPLQFPAPQVKHIDFGEPAANYIYKRSTVIMATVTPPADLPIGQAVQFSAKARFQYCKDEGQCFNEPGARLPLSLPVVSATARVSPSDEAGSFAAARRRLPVSTSKWVTARAVLSQDRIRPGDQAALAVVVDIKPGYKIQRNQPTVEGLISTELVLEGPPAGIKAFPMPTYPPPLDPQHPLAGFEGSQEYRGQLVIRVPVTARDSLQGPSVTFSGLLLFQACDKKQCFPPEALAFAVTVPVAEPGASVTATEPSDAGSHPEIDTEKTAAVGANTPVAASSSHPEWSENLAPVEVDSVSSALFFIEKLPPKVRYMLYAFLGGLILNVMPCVLPVIAIKVIGFVQQAGEHHLRVFLLNVAYSVGVITVFLILATLAVVLGIGWGGLFQRPEFNLAMAGLVFAMGLSLLGVFEIPIPGFASSGGSEHQEGLVGAFLTGILATLLATPCSGPFLGVTLGWSVRQDAAITYLVWATMGLGMASPYLVFAVFPGAIKWLPRPGNWMVRFKELAGLVLMGTVVFILTLMEETYTIPTLVMLLGLALGFWMIGSLYDLNSDPKRKLLVRGTAVLLTTAICFFGFTTVKSWMEGRRDRRLAQIKDEWRRQTGAHVVADEVGHSETELPWQPFTEQRLHELVAQQKTVLVDFSADWCLTCKTNEATALNTQATRRLVDEWDIATLYADYTGESPEIKKWLAKFDSISVPLTVIFPAREPDRPIILRDLYSQSRLLKSLQTAGPSAGITGQATRSTARAE